MHLSGYHPDVLRLWLSSLSSAVLNIRVRSGHDGTVGLSAAARTEQDRILNCPLLAQTRLYLFACEASGSPADACRQSMSNDTYVFAQIDDSLSRGACKAEASAPLDQLLSPPTPIEF